MADVRIRVIGEDRATKQLGAIDGALSKLAVGLAAVTGAAVALKKGFDFAEEGAKLQRLEASGRSLASSFGSDMDLIVSKVQSASLNTVSKMDVIQSSNRAMMLGLGADADQLANLMEVAAFRGRAMGLSTTQAFTDIVTGVGRMSPMILDNLGIVIDASRRYEEYGEKVGIAASDIDAATKRQILLNSVLEEGNRQMAEAGGLIADTATSYEQLTAGAKGFWDAQKQYAGTSFEPAVKSLANMFEINRLSDEAMKQGLMTYEDYRQLTTRVLIGIQDSGDTVDFMNKMLSVNSAAYRASGKSSRDYSRDIAEVGREAETFGIMLPGMSQRLYENQQAAESADRAMTGYDESLVLTNRHLGDSTGILDHYARKAIEAQDATQRWGLIAKRAREDQDDGANSVQKLTLQYEKLSGSFGGVREKAKGFLDELDFIEAGGRNLELTFEKIAALEADPEVKRGLLENALVAATELDVELGNLSQWEGAAFLKDALDLSSLQEAVDLLSGADGITDNLMTLDGMIADAQLSITDLASGQLEIINDMISSFEGVHVATLVINTVGGDDPNPSKIIPGLSSGSNSAIGSGFTHMDFAQGTDGYRVPSGFPNDSFIAGFTSGEELTVSKPGQSGAKTVINNYYTINNNNKEAVAMMKSQFEADIWAQVEAS